MPISPYQTDNLHSQTGTYPVIQKRQVIELLDVMSPTTVPFLKLIGIDGEPGRSTKLEWLEEQLLAETSKVNDNPLTNVAVTLNVPAGDGINFQKGGVIKIESEFLYISAVATDALTVVRGIAGTAAAQHAQNTVIEIVGLANFENTASPTSGTTELTAPYNLFQDFDTSYQMSYKSANLDLYGIPEGDDSHELEKAFKQVVIKLERTAILCRRAAANGNTTPSLMGGLDYFLSSAYGTNHYEANLSGADVTETDLNDALQAIYEKVGEDNMSKTILTSYWNKRVINDLYAPSHRSARNERVGGVLVNTLDTDLGPIDVVHSLRCPKDTIYFLNLDFLSIHPFNGLAFFDQELSRDGAYTRHQIYGSYSMSCRNTRSMGVIRGTSTKAS